MALTEIRAWRATSWSLARLNVGGRSRSTRSLIICVLLCANTKPKFATVEATRPAALGVAWLRNRRSNGSPSQIFHTAMLNELSYKVTTFTGISEPSGMLVTRKLFAYVTLAMALAIGGGRIDPSAGQP